MNDWMGGLENANSKEDRADVALYIFYWRLKYTAINSILNLLVLFVLCAFREGEKRERSVAVFLLLLLSSTWPAWWELTVDHSLQQQKKRRRREENGEASPAVIFTKCLLEGMHFSQGPGFQSPPRWYRKNERLVAKSARDDRPYHPSAPAFCDRAKTSTETKDEGLCKYTTWGVVRTEFLVSSSSYGNILVRFAASEVTLFLCVLLPGALWAKKGHNGGVFFGTVYQISSACVVQVVRCSTSRLVLEGKKKETVWFTELNRVWSKLTYSSTSLRRWKILIVTISFQWNFAQVQSVYSSKKKLV